MKFVMMRTGKIHIVLLLLILIVGKLYSQTTNNSGLLPLYISAEQFKNKDNGIPYLTKKFLSKNEFKYAVVISPSFEEASVMYIADGKISYVLQKKKYNMEIDDYFTSGLINLIELACSTASYFADCCGLDGVIRYFVPKGKNMASAYLWENGTSDASKSLVRILDQICQCLVEDDITAIKMLKEDIELCYHDFLQYIPKYAIRDTTTLVTWGNVFYPFCFSN